MRAIILTLLLLLGCGANSDTNYKYTHCLIGSLWTDSVLEKTYILEVKRCEELLISCKIACNKDLSGRCDDLYTDAMNYCKTVQGFPKI